MTSASIETSNDALLSLLSARSLCRRSWTSDPTQFSVESIQWFWLAASSGVWKPGFLFLSGQVKSTVRVIRCNGRLFWSLYTRHERVNYCPHESYRRRFLKISKGSLSPRKAKWDFWVATICVTYSTGDTFLGNRFHSVYSILVDDVSKRWLLSASSDSSRTVFESLTLEFDPTSHTSEHMDCPAYYSTIEYRQENVRMPLKSMLKSVQRTVNSVIHW